MTIVGAKRHAQLTAEGVSGGVTNYYIGHLALRGLPHYARVRAKEVLSGIDVIYYGAGSDIEYDFVIHPGADPGAIRLRFDANSRPALDESGNLVLDTSLGRLVQQPPQVWQDIDGRRERVDCRYVLRSSGEVRLALGTYRRGNDLTVDPVLSVATYWAII